MQHFFVYDSLKKEKRHMRDESQKNMLSWQKQEENLMEVPIIFS